MVETPRMTISTTWELRTYDVLGNARDGYEVNDYFTVGTFKLKLIVQTHNVGTEHEFQSATPSDKLIRRVFGVRCHLQIGGDDTLITVNHERDGYPIGEMCCTSHASLSPIRVAE